MTIAKVTIVLFSLAAFALTLRRFARERSSFRSTLVWAGIWLVMPLLIIFPGFIDMLMAVAQMRNRLFFLTTMALLILFALFFQQSAKTEVLQRRLNRLAQDIALRRYEDEQKDRPKQSSESDSGDDASGRP